MPCFLLGEALAEEQEGQGQVGQSTSPGIMAGEGWEGVKGVKTNCYICP